MTRGEVAPGFTVNVERAGSGPPVVVLHGFTGSARAWGAFGERLAEHFTTVAVDIAGHGHTTLAAELDHYRMPQVVEDVVSAVRQLGFERPSWLGYSMGGRLALHIAAAHPEAVARLALIGASPGIAAEEGRAERRASDEDLARMLETQGIEAFVDHWESIPLFESQRRLPEEARAAIRAERLASDPVGLANSLRGMGTGAQEPLHDRLASLTMPALLMAGELDTRYVAIGGEMAGAMPNARFVEAPAAGHAAHTENPTFCASEVIRFLQDAPEGER